MFSNLVVLFIIKFFLLAPLAVGRGFSKSCKEERSEIGTEDDRPWAVASSWQNKMFTHSAVGSRIASSEGA